jgi:hypothetical protein
LNKKVSLPNASSKPLVDAQSSVPSPGHDSVPAQSVAIPRFPIVAIGASAGGLEAFEQFFRACPVKTGLAFVLVPHLDPGHHSLLSDIWQRSTAMPVMEGIDQVAVEPDHVYIIAPNRERAIFNGALQLSTPTLARGQRMPGVKSLHQVSGNNSKPGRVEDWRADTSVIPLHHVSSPFHIERSERISRTTLSCVFHAKGYVTYRAGPLSARKSPLRLCAQFDRGLTRGKSIGINYLIKGI